MKPKVSILIPVYNREKMISECIQSALDQTFEDFEVIVVDNKSEDLTFQICQGFAEQDPRVKVFQNDTNIGPVRNWQACATKASGEFCKVLFSDDALMSTNLEKMVPRLHDPEVAFVFCAARVGETLEKSKVAYDLGPDVDISPKQFVKLALRAKVPFSPGAVLFRTNDFRQNLKTDFPTATKQPFDMHGAGPDVMTMLLTALDYKRIAYVNSPEVYFRSHSGSFTITNAGGLIQSGYSAAICFFLRNHVGYLIWAQYVSLLWLQNMRRKKKLLSLRSFLLDHEGNGHFYEIGLAAIFSLSEASKQLIGRGRI